MSQQSASCLSSPSTRSGNVDKVYLWDRDLSFSIQFIMTYTCIVMIMTKQWPSMNLRWGSAYIGTKTKWRLQRACSFSCLLQQLLAFFYKSRWCYLWKLLLMLVMTDGSPWRPVAQEDMASMLSMLSVIAAHADGASRRPGLVDDVGKWNTKTNWKQGWCCWGWTVKRNLSMHWMKASCFLRSFRWWTAQACHMFPF